MDALRAEHRLLLHCSTTSVNVERAGRIKSLASQKIEWGYLLRIARAHSVMSLVFRTLNSTCPENVPEPILNHLRGHFYETAGRNLFLAKELVKVVQLLESHGISSVSYKGPLLGKLIHGNVALREFGDLDILVHKREYLTAQQVLVAQGYRLVKGLDWECTLVHECGTFAVDLHQRMTARDFPCPLNFEYLSGRLERISLAGAAISTLSPEDTLLMLAVQIAKDSGSRYFQLAKICDLAELIRAHPQLDLAQNLRHAKELGGRRILLFALLLANGLLDAPVPQEILSEARVHPRLDLFVEHARRQFFDDANDAAGNQANIAQFRWFIRERLRDKLSPYYQRYITDVLIPCALDQRLVPMPQKLAFLYYFIRPARLIGKYGIHQIRKTVKSKRSLT